VSGLVQIFHLDGDARRFGPYLLDGAPYALFEPSAYAFLL